MDGKIVSMRCLRHKKRFNVPIDWMETCGWLCPHCYENIPEEEYGKYAPKNGIVPEVRDAEEGKPTMYPSFWMEGGIEVESCEEEHVKEPEPKEEKPHRHYNTNGGDIKDNPAFSDFLPRYEIDCQLCRKTVKCHYPWFSTSTVLCPECYSSMSEAQIEEFHMTHHAEIPKLKTFASTKTATHDISTSSKMLSRDISWTRESRHLPICGRWTNDRIMSSTRKELIDGVKDGMVSAVRARIELKRRGNLDYYDLCPKI